MNKKKTLVLLSCVVIVTILSGCGTFHNKDTGPHYAEFNFQENEPVKPLKRINNKNNAHEVIDFARSLSKEGRYKEAAGIYLDASNRFQSKNGNFEVDCRMAAVKEFWLAGDLNNAYRVLKSLEEQQDIYSYAGETEAIRKLRKLLDSTVKLKNELNTVEQNTI